MSRYLVKEFFRSVRSEGISEGLREAREFIINPKRHRRFLQLWQLRFSTGDWTLTREINGSKMLLNFHPGSPHIIEQDLAIYGKREPGSTDLFDRKLTDIRNSFDESIHVFDIGANIGYFSLLEGLKLRDSDKIYAIEAEPRNAKRLTHNIEINGYSNIEVLQIAAGESKGEQELEIAKTSNMHQMGLISEDDTTDRIIVDVWPIDMLIEKKDIAPSEPIIIRMDIEGYEEYALRGMSEFLSSNQPGYIFLEIHTSNTSPEKVLTMIENGGFQPEYISYDNGTTHHSVSSFDDIRKINSTTHLFASRLPE